jgi:hypothetical protein
MKTQAVITTIARMQSLSSQLDRLYREMKPERRAIAQWEEAQDYSILGVIELFSSDIQGYVVQLEAQPSMGNPVATLVHLRKLNPFDTDYFSNWYFSQGELYPATQQYIEYLDHLRLLLMEYLSAQLPLAA